MLTFAALRAANLARIPKFRDKHGRLCHNFDGSDWSVSDWLMALMGELGELANLLKKVKRGDYTEAEASAEVAKELADVQIYLDILAYRCGVDLGAATVSKFNEVSLRVNCDVTLTPQLPYAWMRHHPLEYMDYPPRTGEGWIPLYRE